MLSYKAPRKSVVKSYLSDPLLYLGVALVVIGISIATLYRQEKSSLVQRVSFLKGNNLQIASTTGLDKDKASAPRAVAAVAPAAPAPPPAIAPPAQATVPAAANAPSASGALAAKPAASIAGPTVHVYYTEVPRAALERIYQESQETGQFNSFGDYTAGILPDVAKRIAAAGLKIRILDKTEKSIAQAQKIFAGYHDASTDEDIGLSTFIELAEMDGNVYRGNLEIVRSWKDAIQGAPSTLQKNSYPAVFELAPGAGFFMAGILPRTRVAHQDDLSKEGPFQILNSQSFHNKETEFVIFIEFEKKP